MQKSSVSLIMPVYNVEKYLEKTLKSVENQSFKDFELIMVDDGSSDKSPEIAQEFCKRNPNFKLIKQENQGPAAARNNAISLSKGKYLAFMDSDDFLEEDFLEILYELAEKYDADIACCNFNMYFPKKKRTVCMPLSASDGLYTKQTALKKLILDIGIHYFIWNKLYRRELFFEKNVKFDDMYFEDIATCPKLFYHAEKIAVTSKPLYNYNFRENSILHSVNAVQINDYIKSIGIIREFLESKSDYKEYSKSLWLYAQKVKFMVYYYTINMHMKASNFKNLAKNLTSAVRSINYFTGSKPIKNSELPFEVVQPEKK